MYLSPCSQFFKVYPQKLNYWVIYSNSMFTVSAARQVSVQNNLEAVNSTPHILAINHHPKGKPLSSLSSPFSCLYLALYLFHLTAFTEAPPS